MTTPDRTTCATAAHKATVVWWNARDGLHIAICTCGWKTTPTVDAARAQREAAIHEGAKGD